MVHTRTDSSNQFPGRDILLSQVSIEEHERVWYGPREVVVRPQPLRGGDAVWGASIEHVAWAFGQARVHGIADLKTDRSVAEKKMTLEVGLLIPVLAAFLS